MEENLHGDTVICYNFIKRGECDDATSCAKLHPPLRLILKSSGITLVKFLPALLFLYSLHTQLHSRACMSSTYMYVCMYVCFICVCMYIHISIYLSMSLSILLFIHLSIYLSTYLYLLYIHLSYLSVY